jgi:peptidoglycan/LPS O-acetylase OafA/YrhL
MPLTVTLTTTQTDSTTKRELTSYLKGIAIIAVLTNHYVNSHITQTFSGYANGLVSFFFILSGYGLYHSLSASYNHDSKLDQVKHFYTKRITRIYPLYWLYYLKDTGLDITQFSLLDFLGLRFTSPKSAWFVPAIIQCYIVAPLLFYLLAKYKWKAYLLTNLAILIVSNILLPHLGIPEGKVWTYRDLYLSHVFIFSLGMLIPALISKYQVKTRKGSLLIVLSLMLLSIHNTTQETHTFDFSRYLWGTLFILMTPLFCYLFIASDVKPPLLKAFSTMGKYSFSLYLFGGLYIGYLYRLLQKLDVTQEYNYLGTLSVIALFPIWFILCALIEEMANNRCKLPIALKNLKRNLV